MTLPDKLNKYIINKSTTIILNHNKENFINLVKKYNICIDSFNEILNFKKNNFNNKYNILTNKLSKICDIMDICEINFNKTQKNNTNCLKNITKLIDNIVEKTQKNILSNMSNQNILKNLKETEKENNFNLKPISKIYKKNIKNREKILLNDSNFIGKLQKFRMDIFLSVKKIENDIKNLKLFFLETVAELLEFGIYEDKSVKNIITYIYSCLKSNKQKIDKLLTSDSSNYGSKSKKITENLYNIEKLCIKITNFYENNNNFDVNNILKKINQNYEFSQENICINKISDIFKDHKNIKINLFINKAKIYFENQDFLFNKDKIKEQAIIFSVKNFEDSQERKLCKNLYIVNFLFNIIGNLDKNIMILCDNIKSVNKTIKKSIPNFWHKFMKFFGDSVVILGSIGCLTSFMFDKVFNGIGIIIAIITLSAAAIRLVQLAKETAEKEIVEREFIELRLNDIEDDME